MKSSIHILYMGKYSNLIGPPKSMIELYELLSNDHQTHLSKNLHKQAQNRKSTHRASVSTRNRPIRTLLSSVIHITLFNIRALFIKIQHPETTLIITQPFLILPLLSGLNILYTRRASTPLNRTIGTDIIKRIVEKQFKSLPHNNLIYLADFEGREPSSTVIPNSISTNKSSSKEHASPRSSVEIFVTGTFAHRKGADRVLKLAPLLPPETTLNLIGDISPEFCQDLPPNVKIHGRQDVPYNQYRVGDIFLSLSRLEGFQKAMVEAMLSGCIVIATSRPDSESISDSQGVFLVSNETTPQTIAEEAHSVFNEINALSPSKRAELGKHNQRLAECNYSREAVKKLWNNIIHPSRKKNAANTSTPKIT